MGTGWENPTPKWPEMQIQEILSAHDPDLKFTPTEKELELIEYYIKEVC
jgi:hypothetical protein